MTGSGKSQVMKPQGPCPRSILPPGRPPHFLKVSKGFPFPNTTTNEGPSIQTELVGDTAEDQGHFISLSLALLRASW